MNNFDIIFNKIIAECNDNKSLAYTNSMIRKNIYDDRNLLIENVKLSLDVFKRNILNESIIQNVPEFIDDILKRIENNETEFTYLKNEIIELIPYFEYKKKFIEEVPNEFRISLMNLTSDEVFKKFGVKPSIGSKVEEFLDPNDMYHECINILDEFPRIRKNVLKSMLEEEVRHIWTYIFGLVDDNFYVGRTSFKTINKIKDKFLNDYQRQILKNMYFNDLKLLQNDYDYIFKIQDGNLENWELSVHIDSILDMIIDDYLEFHKDETTEKYIFNIFKSFKTNNFKDEKSTILEKFYSCDDKIFKDNVRRMFLIFAFGNEEQINYLKENCEKEFGNIME